MSRVLAIASIILFAPVAAITGELTPKQQKMQECNDQARAKGLRGDEQQKFMSACLIAKAPENQGVSQQDRAKTCARDATDKGLKGDERKKFMGACLAAK